MIVRIIALTGKGEDALRRYIQSSKDIEARMNELPSYHPKKIKFNIEQRSAKKVVNEDFFENPLMIVATLDPKYNSNALVLVSTIENAFHKIMLNSGCGKNDYVVEVK